MPDSYNNSNKNDTKASIEDKQKKVEYGGQCKATTKKGTRCSRTAGSNGYCWQHSWYYTITTKAGAYSTKSCLAGIGMKPITT